MGSTHETLEDTVSSYCVISSAVGMGQTNPGESDREPDERPLIPLTLDTILTVESLQRLLKIVSFS
ncbi:MAG: hypothetical protein HQL94_11100 [Magnetococcales bacterium]|nr:hypothetical protein [Magnetococcales bacterium]MBF0439590.1 hypothetical protein [Magnetococcales bacterium]